MSINKEKYQEILTELNGKVTLVAVSKTKPVEDILELYSLGHRDFGENYVQELVEKAGQLPKDIRWHFIGHLQTNKVKLIAPFVHLVHGVDSFRLLKEINKQAEKNGRVINCLLQVHIAMEETKFGLNEEELNDLVNQIAKEPMNHIRICGLMAMASLTDDMDKVRGEFKHLKEIFNKLKTCLPERQAHDSRFTIISMGMSSDFKIAIEEGGTMVRIGSLVFGERS